MLTKEEQNIVVEAMRKYPSGVNVWCWGSSPEFLDANGNPKTPSGDIELLSDAILLKSG